LQAAFFKRADQLVVEMEHVREGLLNRDLGSESAIYVVRNSLSSLYLEPESWQAVSVPVTNCVLKLGFLGRNYKHKNTGIFPQVIDFLQCNYGINARIYVTFTEDEWAACDDAFRSAVTNVGALFVAQCPSFYSSMDAVIFPSLLECFSATPLEAMVMGKPLFASDRPFNREVCHSHAHYFDPLSPASAATAIAKVFANGVADPRALQIARDHAIHFSNPKERAKEYLSLLMQSTNKSEN
jgi:glycosyltransferase involved in cell wall biosynthesis